MKVGKWNITVKDLIWLIVCLIIIIAFIAGLIIYNKAGASDIISGASTVASIALSLIAMLYTMIESANSSAVNQSTIGKLTEIDGHINEVVKKIDDLKDIERRIKVVLPSLISQAKIIQNTAGVPPIAPNVTAELEYLQKYFEEDIEE